MSKNVDEHAGTGGSAAVNVGDPPLASRAGRDQLRRSQQKRTVAADSGHAAGTVTCTSLYLYTCIPVYVWLQAGIPVYPHTYIPVTVVMA